MRLHATHATHVTHASTWYVYYSDLLDGVSHQALDTTQWPGVRNNFRPLYSKGNDIHWHLQVGSKRGRIAFILFPERDTVGETSPEGGTEQRIRWWLSPGNGTTFLGNMAGNNGGAMYLVRTVGCCAGCGSIALRFHGAAMHCVALCRSRIAFLSRKPSPLYLPYPSLCLSSHRG